MILNSYKLLMLFIGLKLAKLILDTILSLINRWHYLNHSKQKAACKELNLSEADFAKILGYTEDKFYVGLISNWIQSLCFLTFLGFGGVTWVEQLVFQPGSTVKTGVLFFLFLGFLSSLFFLPFELYQVFVIEQKHGFNRQTLKVFFLDQLKGFVLGVIFVAPLLWLLLWVIESMDHWWLFAWAVMSFFSLLLSWLYPVIIAPMFNTFKPLDIGDLKEKIDALAKKVQFQAKEVFVMDGSQRSTHGNAYFTGIFGKKRIVLFDTLLKDLSFDEIIAVLAHELGHFKLRHIVKGLFQSVVMTGCFFYLAHLFQSLEILYQAFGLAHISSYGLLFVFSLWYGAFDMILSPFMAGFSQKKEFEADAFASQTLGSSQTLKEALIKLQKQNQSMPLCHPLYARFYHSHPPLLIRLKALEKRVG